MLLKFKFKFHIKRHVTKKQAKICLITFCVPHFIQILVIQAKDTNKINVANCNLLPNRTKMQNSLSQGLECSCQHRSLWHAGHNMSFFIRWNCTI